MRKSLLFLLCGLFVFSACNFEDTYTLTNVTDLVTVKGDNLVNDYSRVLTVTEDAVGRVNWQVEGARYFAIYDILNRSLDIKLKEMIRSWKTDLEEYGNPEDYPTDPVEPFLACFSGGYFNLGFTISKARNTNNAHVIRFFFQNEGEQLKLHVIHYGEGEDLRTLSKDDLLYEDRVYHISADEFPSYSTLSLVYHYLDTDATGAIVLKEGNAPIR